MDKKDSKSPFEESSREGNVREVDALAQDVQSWWGKTFVFIKKTKVKTWQGVFILAFAAGAAAAVVWTVSMDIESSSKAAGETARLFLDADNTEITLGDQENPGNLVEMDIVLDTNESDVVAVKAIVTYNTSDFRLDNYDTSGSSFAADNACTYNSDPCEIIDNDTENGRITIVVAKPSPGINSSSATVAHLVFEALRSISPSDQNFELSFSGVGNYDDSDVIFDDGRGTDILTEATGVTVTVNSSVCTSFEYSDYGDCAYDANLEGYYQHKTVVSQSPEGCVGGNPELYRSCTAPECSQWTYGDWEPEVCPESGLQTRTFSNPLPIACEGGTPVTEQTCIPGAVTCNFNITDWEPTVCPSSGKQTRTVTASPEGCTGGGAPPAEEQDCEYVPPTCEYEYGDWTPEICPAGGGTQTRTETRSPDSPDDCVGGERRPTSQTCTPDMCSNFDYSEWNPSVCPASGIQTRQRLASFPENCEGGTPELTQSCNYVAASRSNNDNNNDNDDDDDDDEEEEDEPSDKKKPKFTDLPSFLSKYRGDKVWWKATDEKKTKNNGIAYYRYKFIGDGDYKKTKNAYLHVPLNISRGVHVLFVRAYDKAGNSALKVVTIRVK
ncbi:MAG: a disintegrin and metalloproteinase with thrombospondin motifs 9 [Patescibacteria group bacterium]|nr:a disintegrin and metalloproteinase with thrombospondin motifs 9 [Patescibacteria group bacterium]